MKTFKIEIDEQQALLILAALKAFDGDDISVNHDDQSELCGMFAGLPVEEDKTPGVIHGFCY